jgi:hypothetical protein
VNTHIFAIRLESALPLEDVVRQLESSLRTMDWGEVRRVSSLEDALPMTERGGLLLFGPESGRMVFANETGVGGRLLVELNPESYPSVSVALNTETREMFAQRIAAAHGGLDVKRDNYGVTAAVAQLEAEPA